MCTSPLKGFCRGLTETGKKDLLITPFSVDHIEFDSLGKRFYRNTPAHVYQDSLDDWILIPCGHCTECRLNRSRQWADRCILELQYHAESYFVTLTYDDDHLPKNEMIDHETGEILEVATLIKKDLSDFMKRLRRYYEYQGNENTIRFFGCGEYGSTTMRPHFHVIIFGLHLDPDGFHLYRQNFNGDNLYTHDFISRCWKFGFHSVGAVTWQSAAYVARYIMKKHLGPDAERWYADHGINPEFTLMSRRPGIARQYYDDHKDELFNQDFVSVGTAEGSRRIFSPRYYDKLFDIDYPSDQVADRRDRRQQAAVASTDLKLSMTDVEYLEYLKIHDSNLNNKMRALVRPDI